MSTRIVATGLEEFGDFLELAPEVVPMAARMAINDVAKRSGINLARREIMEQVNFPSGYLSNDRLFVAKLARDDDLEAIIIGRDRPTSLARFATGPIRAGQRGVRVAVHKGEAVMMRKAFIVPLYGRSGDGSNLGLAIRLKPGERIYGRREAGNVDYNVFKRDKNGTIVLLYGPSVDQVFRSVADDIAPELADDVTSEFFRQFARMTNG